MDFTVLLLIPFSILLPLIRRWLSSLLSFSILVSLTINWFSSLLLFSLLWRFLWISGRFVDFSGGGFSHEFVFPTDSVSSFLGLYYRFYFQYKSPYCHYFFSIFHLHFYSKQLLLLIIISFVFRYFWSWHLRIPFNCWYNLILSRSSPSLKFLEFNGILTHPCGMSIAKSVFISFLCWFPWKHISLYEAR